MQCDIPFNPNPFLTHFFLSPEWVSAGRQAAGLAHDLYAVTVAHQTGALAASGRIDSALGGEKFDRVVFDVSFGHNLPRGGYGAAHEFGIGIHPESRVPPTHWMPQDPVDDWVKVLAIMDSLP
ncbi:hypothetical protein ORI20_14060 [Mycobacterium sp. CVI_P3]|uniref:Uncharacterized protein n=1 Tax=Mycobacterium pinniadriaticum TaxID=2994102 RepID=A0ABT3SE96_9MYCO|nr:hypothetical protein [Mycobacterium pinniadriaticum]MCX2931405.1 hypothetical protein [Mycobacterium pinniadriaticum]MCX2937829.1 hypothetical protein [Mycobacterium pinniadriaticum]